LPIAGVGHGVRAGRDVGHDDAQPLVRPGELLAVRRKERAEVPARLHLADLAARSAVVGRVEVELLLTVDLRPGRDGFAVRREDPVLRAGQARLGQPPDEALLLRAGDEEVPTGLEGDALAVLREAPRADRVLGVDEALPDLEPVARQLNRDDRILARGDLIDPD